MRSNISTTLHALLLYQEGEGEKKEKKKRVVALVLIRAAGTISPWNPLWTWVVQREEGGGEGGGGGKGGGKTTF